MHSLPSTHPPSLSHFPHAEVFFPLFLLFFFLSPSFSCSVGQQHQKCFNRALMALPLYSPSANLTSDTHSLKHMSAHADACTPRVGNSSPVVGEGKVSRQEKMSGREEERGKGLVLLMEDDMPSFSHPQLPPFCFLLIGWRHCGYLFFFFSLLIKLLFVVSSSQPVKRSETPQHFIFLTFCIVDTH